MTKRLFGIDDLPPVNPYRELNAKRPGAARYGVDGSLIVPEIPSEVWAELAVTNCTEEQREARRHEIMLIDNNSWNNALDGCGSWHSYQVRSKYLRLIAIGQIGIGS